MASEQPRSDSVNSVIRASERDDVLAPLRRNLEAASPIYTRLSELLENNARSWPKKPYADDRQTQVTEWDMFRDYYFNAINILLAAPQSSHADASERSKLLTRLHTRLEQRDVRFDALKATIENLPAESLDETNKAEALTMLDNLRIICGRLANCAKTAASKAADGPSP